MILDRLTFQYQDKIIIEKIVMQAPFRYEAIFENSGCFIYFKDRAPKLLSSELNVHVNSKEAVLLKCGSHFLDILKATDDNRIEAIAFHLYPDLLKKLYTGELPTIIEKGSNRTDSQVIAPIDLIAKFIESLEFYFQNPSLVNNDLLELKIKELILLLVQSKNVNSILELVSDLYSAKKVRLKEVMDLHLYSDLKLNQLAQLCNLSLSSFKRNFKKEFKDSPTNYINAKRIEKAKELLRISTMPISEIAYKLGFQDPLYFTRVFKKKTSISPSDYRKDAI